MTEHTPMLSPEILEEASSWFIDFNEGNVDYGARKRFNAWLRRSPQHVHAYLQITALWEDASFWPACNPAQPVNSDTECTQAHKPIRSDADRT